MRLQRPMKASALAMRPPCHSSTARNRDVDEAHRDDAGERDAEPREDRDEIDGRGRDRPEADPGQPRVDEGGVGPEERRDDDRDGDQGDDPERGAEEGQRHEREERDGVEHAERRRSTRRRRCRCRCSRRWRRRTRIASRRQNFGQWMRSPWARTSDAPARKTKLPRIERCSDDPCRIGGDVDLKDAEIEEVPGDVIADHREERDAAQDVDQPVARAARRPPFLPQSCRNPRAIATRFQGRRGGWEKPRKSGRKLGESFSEPSPIPTRWAARGEQCKQKRRTEQMRKILLASVAVLALGAALPSYAQERAPKVKRPAPSSAARQVQ